MAINKIMVLGAGTMGMGIAQVFAEAGKTVLVRDIADAFIQRGEGVLKKNLEKKVAKGKITEEQKNDMLSRVSFTLELADAKDCDPGGRGCHRGSGHQEGHLQGARRDLQA